MSLVARREYRSPGQSSYGGHLTRIAQASRATPLKVGDAPLRAEMILAKKTSASKKKEPQAPVISALRDSPSSSRKTTEAARSDVQSPSTTYKILGGIESESFALPPSQSPRTSIRTASPATDGGTPLGASSSDHNPSPLTFSSHDIRTPNRGYTKKRLSPAVLESDFTFRPMTPISSRTQPTPSPGTPPSFKIPGTTASPARNPLKLESTRRVERARSIFDVLHDRSRLAVNSISAEVAMPSWATDRIAAVGDDLQEDLRPEQIAHAANLQYSAKARVETEVFQLAETELNKSQETHETVTAATSQSVALVLRSQVSSLPPEPDMIPLSNLLHVSEPTETWHSSRIFFAATDGHTRLVDFEQTMYDVDVVEDDGGSDFDSIASPAKFSPAKFDPRLSLLCDDTKATSSSDEIETEFDVEDLAELRRFDCTFTMCGSERIGGIITPATTNSFSDDEDVMELCLRVQPPEAVQTTTVDMPANVVIAETPDPNDNLSTPLGDDEFDLDCGSGVEISAKDLSVASSLRPLIAVTNPDELRGFQPSRVSDAESDQACDFEEAMIDAAPVHQIDIAHDLLSTHVVKEFTASVEKAENATASEPFSSDWASELTRPTLGTESLFTFLDRLHTGNNVSAEKSSIVAAFLDLVNLERSELGQRSLTQSYTASTVIASRIIPHTIFLGTTKLNTFLTNLTFGTNGETTIEEVHRVSKALSKEDLHLQAKATTGIMGALGRRLGKFPLV
jgi:hypothetical protein